VYINTIETFSASHICFVRVLDNNGDYGWGMTAPFSANITAQVLHQICSDTAFESFDDFTTVADNIITKQYKFLGSFLARAAAGIDTALWDLYSRKKGLSVAEMAGKKRDKIDLYASSMKRDLPVQEEADRLRTLQDKFGYRSIKLHPGIPVGQDMDHWPNRTEDMVKAMVKTAKSGTEIIVDVNGNYSVNKAIEMAKFFQEQGVVLFEEPCPYWEIDQTKAVREACEKIGIAVAGGEQDYVEPVWQRMIDDHVMDVCQPDLLYLGGFTRSLRVAQYAAAKGRPVTPHTSNQSPIFIMGLHYMAVIEKPYHFLECGIEDDAWAITCYKPLVEIKDGSAFVPKTAGWGFEPTEEFLAKSEYRISKKRL